VRLTTRAESRRKHVRSHCAVTLWYEGHAIELITDVFANAGFLVATFNCRGAGKSGGHGSASAQTEAADYETVLGRVMSYAENSKVPISNLYICVLSILFSNLTLRDIVSPLFFYLH